MADRNEMCVPLIEGFRLRADDDNWIIEEEVGTDKRVWRVFGYYQKLGIALNDVFTCVLRRLPSRSVQDLIEASERARQAVIHAVMPLDLWGVKSETFQKVF